MVIKNRVWRLSHEIDAKSKFSYPLQEEDERDSISLNIMDDIITQVKKKGRCNIIEKMHDTKPNINHIQEWITSWWRVKNKVKSIFIPNDFILLIFILEEDKDYVLSKPWFLKRRGLILEKWYLSFDPEKTQLW